MNKPLLNRLSLALAFALVTLTFAGQAMASEEAGIKLGDAYPSGSVEMLGVDGKTLTIDAAKGEKGTLVIFTCNHCPYVKAWDTRIAELGNTYSKKGIGVIAINSNDPTTYADDGLDGMKERAASLSLEYPYVVDATSEVAVAFGATKTPEAFIFDAAGKLVYHGTIDDNSEDASAVTKTYLKDALEAVIAGTAVAKAETKAMGCGIKFRK